MYFPYYICLRIEIKILFKNDIQFVQFQQALKNNFQKDQQFPIIVCINAIKRISEFFKRSFSNSMRFHFSILTWTFSHLVFPLGDTSVVHGWHGGLESLIKVMISLEKRDTLVVYGGGEFFKNGTYLLVTTTIKASIVMQKSSFSP